MPQAEYSFVAQHQAQTAKRLRERHKAAKQQLVRSLVSLLGKQRAPVYTVNT
jgi:hypothetical protein